MARPLGRREPKDFTHIDKYPLRNLPKAERPAGVPMLLGVNWYPDFDYPTQDAQGRWWVAKSGIRSRYPRGGHAICLKPGVLTDPLGWWEYYNQGQEGACVGFAGSRMTSILNRVKYNARWLWHQARLTDEWADNDDLNDNNQGTSVRAALEILKEKGALRSTLLNNIYPMFKDGISAYRWATTMDEVLDTLAMPLAETLEAVPFLNSWGMQYPHITWMPLTVLERLRREAGEIAIITDR